MDCVNGINAYHTLDEVCGLLEKGEADEFLKMLEEMACYIFRADHLMLDCTADESSLEEICGRTGALAGRFLRGKDTGGGSGYGTASFRSQARQGEGRIYDCRTGAVRLQSRKLRQQRAVLIREL